MQMLILILVLAVTTLTTIDIVGIVMNTKWSAAAKGRRPTPAPSASRLCEAISLHRCSSRAQTVARALCPWSQSAEACR